MKPEAVEQFRKSFAEHLREENPGSDANRKMVAAKIAVQQKAINGCMRAIRADVGSDTIYAELKEAERRKADLLAEQAQLENGPPELPADLAELYREHIGNLAPMLSDPAFVHRAAEALAEILDRIIVYHEDGQGHTVQLEGNIVGLLGLTNDERSEANETSERSLKLVAGATFERTALENVQESIELGGRIISGADHCSAAVLKSPKRHDLTGSLCSTSDFRRSP